MTDTLAQRIQRIVTSPSHELGRWARFVQFQLELWRFCARRLRENNVMAMSAALSFRTIFAMVPALVLALLVLKSLGTLEDGKRSLRQFLDASGFTQIVAVQEGEGGKVPASADAPGPDAKVINIADEIESLVTQVETKLTFERIGPIGALLLIWTALSLLTTMEQSLNRIFGAPRGRSVARQTFLYWSAMTLIPIAFVAAGYLGKTASAALEGVRGAAWLVGALGWAASVLLGIGLLAALYKLLPNTHVRYRSAVGGAVVAVPLWLVAKWGFALYVQRLVLKGNLYGVLGLLPLFLLWLNYSWLIFLFGAQLAHTAVNLRSLRQADLAENLVLGPSDLLAAALAIARPYLAGQGFAERDRIAAALNLPAEAAHWLIDRLSAAGLVSATGVEAEGGYVLVRPPDRLRVREILQVGDPRGRGAAAAGYAPELAGLVARVQHRADAALENWTLADVLDGAAVAVAKSGTAQPGGTALEPAGRPIPGPCAAPNSAAG